MPKQIIVSLIKIIKHRNPNKRCKCCECDESEHDVYWYCPHFKGDICEVCCIYDSLDPNWNWEECCTCIHDQERDKTSII
jgi:hypothetical protein